jgi:hypothetical protein
MLTPGIAGTAAMGIANALSSAFEIRPEITALVISFLLSSTAIASGSLARWQRLVFFLLNGLVIFSVSIGADAAGSLARERGRGKEFVKAATILVSESQGVDARADSALADFLGPDADPGTRQALAEAIRGGEPGRFAARLPDGRHLLVESHPVDSASWLAWNPAATPMPSDVQAVRLVEETPREFFGDWFVKRRTLTTSTDQGYRSTPDRTGSN